MPTDILFDDNTVTLQGARIRVDGEDLEVRSSKRMPASAKDQLRRAMVHGEQDQLIVNFRRDYSHTELHGPLHIKTQKVPAMLALYDGDQVNARIIVGELRLVRDVLVPLDGRTVTDVTKLDDRRDSVAHTLRWLMQRLDAIEKRLGVQPPPRPTRSGEPG